MTPDAARCAWELAYHAWTEAAAAQARGEPVMDGDVLALKWSEALAWSRYVWVMRHGEEAQRAE